MVKDLQIGTKESHATLSLFNTFGIDVMDTK